MKKTVMTIAMLVGVSAASSVVANNGMKVVEIEALSPAADLNVQALAGLKFRLSFDTIQKKSYIVLKDNKGEVLFTDYPAKTGKYDRVFDLSNLNDGSYSFEVVNGNDKAVKNFEIATKVERTASL